MKRTMSLQARLAASPPMISFEEFLKLAAISRTSFYRYLASGKLKAVKRGHFTFVQREEALRFLTSGEPLVTPSMRRTTHDD